MRLTTLRLDHFKQAIDRQIEANGANINIYGPNGSGKTTIADAPIWLLFGKDLLNRADHEIKTRDDDGNPLHHLNHSVEGTFETGDGQLTLRRVYSETYTKKRGSPIQDFTGHTTDYFINSVPVQKREYDDRVASICSEKRFRILTDPTYFMSLPWQDRRKVLFDVCGDLTDDDVIDRTPALSGLRAILGNYTLEEYRKIVAARRTEINKELVQIPARIDEANRALPLHLAGDHQANLDRHNATMTALRTKRAEAAAGGGIADKKVKLKEADARILEISNRFKAQGNPAREAAMARVREADARIATANNAVLSVTRRIDDARIQLTGMASNLASLRAEWNRINAEAFHETSISPTECSACGQPLPEDKREAARQGYETRLGNFNEAKAKRLFDNQAQGRALNGRKVALEGEVAGWEAELAAARAEHQTALDAKVAIVVPENEVANYFDDPDYSAAQFERDALADEIERMGQDASVELAEIDHEIGAAQSLADAARHDLDNASRRKEGLKRVDELKGREKQLAQEFETLEGHLFLTEEFVRAKVSLLTDKINARFKVARFTLFEAQVNGGLRECCDVTYLGLPPSNGQAINVGLDIINVLSKHFGFAPMVLIDNAESVSDLLPTAGQQIRMIVAGKVGDELEIKIDGAARPTKTSRIKKDQEALIS